MKILDKAILSLIPFVYAKPILAAEEPPKLTGDYITIGGVLDKIMNIIFPVAGLICVVFVIIGGYMYMTAAGDSSKTKQAQSTLTWAIIGLVFIVLAVAIIKVITNFVEQ